MLSSFIVSGSTGRLGSPGLTALGLVAGWLIWRVWTFTILPYLRPHKPKELPYHIPFIGHLFSFWWNSGAVIEAASEITKDTQKPVAVTICGMKLYFVFDPSDVMATFRNGTTLSWDKFLDELLVLFGVSRVAITDSLHRHNPDLEELYSRVTSRPVKHKSLRHFTEVLYIRQLAVDRVDDLSLSFFQTFLQAATSQQSSFSMPAGGPTQMPLRLLVDRTVSRSVAQMLFGEAIFELEPSFTEHTVGLADDLWRIVYRYPKFLARDFYNSYERVMVAVERWSLLGPQKLESASFMMRTMLEAEQLYDLDPRSAACLVCIMYIAAFANVQATTFWLLSYLLFDEDLCAAIREETKPAFKDGTFDTNYITQSCPLLMSTYSEVLRLHIVSNSVRVVDAPTRFGDKILEAGNILMVPFGYMHHNARAWGADNSKFNPTRFLRTKEGHAVNNPAYRPFGAGGNSCPGKALALRQVLSSVAYFLHTYDLSVPIIGGKKQSMPIALSSTPTIGTSVPQAGKDLIVQLSPRLSEPVSHIIATSSQIPS